MTLSMFAVVHERGSASALFDDPLVHCYAGKQIVLAYISRQALEDYFRIPGDVRITLAQWNMASRKRWLQARRMQTSLVLPLCLVTGATSIFQSKDEHEIDFHSNTR